MKGKTAHLAIALPVFLSILLAQGCASGPSESESAVYRSVVGLWTSSEDLDLPLEEMSLMSFSLDPDGRLILSQYEADPQCRVWFGIDDFRVEDGFLKWFEFRAKVMPDSNTMRMDYFPPDGQPIPFTLRRLDRGEDFMMKLDASTARGYSYKMPEKTAASFKGGWFSAGDMARRDEDGYFEIVDRKDNLIITGGEHVYPSEVEKVIGSHPDVLDVAIIGLPDKTWGEAVTAFIIPRDANSPPGEKEIISFCSGKIAGFKRPKEVRLITQEEMPRTGSGKILHRALRQRHAGELEH